MANHNRKTLKTFRLHALRIHPFCQWCNCPLTRNTSTTDHVIPRSRGGTNDWGNLCLACGPCNQARKNDLPHALPSGPHWGKDVTVLPVAIASLRPRWVAWTRYPGGRWRAMRGYCREKLLQRVRQTMGRVVEVVIVPEGEEAMARKSAENRPFLEQAQAGAALAPGLCCATPSE
jgi:hypothetical protein